MRGGNAIVAIIDAELASGKISRFPNLACMKISSYNKGMGKKVVLKTDYKDLEVFEKVYISKVFTKTAIPDEILLLPNVIYGGTGFFYANAEPLPYEVEHAAPDYLLYASYVNEQQEKGIKQSVLKSFTDYSIGFLTRGCFRKCGFCVNQKYDSCVKHSDLSEFYEPDRKKIMLLDDNILAYPGWRKELELLCGTGKPFTFKQGIDIRLLGVDFIKLISKTKYDGEIYFAFDNINDKSVIERKLHLFRSYSKKPVCMYVFCGYDTHGRYDVDFWLNDIENIFKRLEIIGRYKTAPYLMRYEKYVDSPFAGLYKNIATYCNNRSIFKQTSFTEFCYNQAKKYKLQTCSEMRYYNEFISKYPYFEARFFNKKYWNGGETPPGEGDFDSEDGYS